MPLGRPSLLFPTRTLTCLALSFPLIPGVTRLTPCPAAKPLATRPPMMPPSVALGGTYIKVLIGTGAAACRLLMADLVVSPDLILRTPFIGVSPSPVATRQPRDTASTPTAAVVIILVQPLSFTAGATTFEPDAVGVVPLRLNVPFACLPS